MIEPRTSGDFGGTIGSNPDMGQEELKLSQVSPGCVFLTILVAAPSTFMIQVEEHNPITLHVHVVFSCRLCSYVNSSDVTDIKL